MKPGDETRSLQRRFRLVLGIFITGLVLSGVTAFPLLHELELLQKLTRSLPAAPFASLQRWIDLVHHGLAATSRDFPWIAYGTDWLAFGHIVIALFFVGAWKEPIRNRWVLDVGLLACLLVIPLALICGPVRGIPLFWRLIDCSFGLAGALPLLYCRLLSTQMEKLRSRA